MKKVLFLVLICSAFLNTRVSAQCNTLPDECINACSLGTLPLPPACSENGGISTGNPLVFNLTNIGATVSLSGSLCAFPSADVWYSFTATGTQLVLNIERGNPVLNNPNVSIYQGTDCDNLIPLVCATGSTGALSQTFSPLTPGTKYYLQVSGNNLFDQGNFRMTISNNLECDNCLLGQSFTAEEPPVNGTYQRKQTVKFCYTVTDYNKTALNWIHGIALSFGPGWDTTSLKAVSIPTSCAKVDGAHWGFYKSDSSYASGIKWGAGFYYETTSGSLGSPEEVDSIPGNNYGDAGVGTSCPVTFCFEITTDSLAPNGTDLVVRVKTTGDYQSGSWTSPGCETDPIAVINAKIAACDVPEVVVTNSSCGTNNGKAVATGFGASPWRYIWTNANGNTIADHPLVYGADSVINLAPGQYFVNVTDSTGCTQIGIATIGGSVDSFTVQTTQIACFGIPTGQITVTPVTVQNAPFTYSFNGASFQSNNSFSNLGAGSYTVIARNRFGCVDTFQRTITQPLPIVITDSVVTSATCSVGGTIDVTASGGTGTLSFRWSNNRTVDSIGDLQGGDYILTITDQNQCTLIDTFTVISTPNAIRFDSSIIVNVSCNGGSNGSITVKATTGTGPFKYRWNTVNNDSTTTIINLRAGAYSVTATDSLGCSASATYNVSEPAPVTIPTVVITPVTCLVKGSITITPAGGTPDYTYRWTTTATTNAITDLNVGPYTVTVTDKNSCTASATYNVTEAPSNFVLSTPTITNATCHGSNNGRIVASTTGGTGNVKFNWSTSANDTTNTVTGLTAPGTYRVTATDALGCSATAEYTVNDPPSITLGSANIGPAACGQGGFIAVKGFGGTGQLSYSWSPTPGGGANDSIFNLAGGIYTLTLKDINNCSITAQYKVDAATGIVSFGNPSIVNLDCNGDGDGAITVSASGGNGTIKYRWSTTATTNTITGLSAGPYSVTATDSLGCSVSATYQITQPAAININGTVLPSGCTSGGSIRLAVTGGTGTITYTWANPQNTTDSAVDLAAGQYSVTVKDQNNCSATASFIVGVSQGGITLNPVITAVRCNGESNGSIAVTATGGNGNKNYRWGAPGNENTSSISNKPAGTYTLTVTDQGTCSATASYTITQPAVLNANLSFRRFICFFDDIDTIRALPTGGNPGYTYRWNDNSTASSLVVAPGNFSVTITDSRGCTISLADSVKKNTQINSTRIYNLHLCAEPPYGDVKFVGNGGTGSLTYTITGIGTNTTGIFPNLSPGHYSFTIRDSVGCTEQDTFNIAGSGAGLTFTVIETPASCFGTPSGTVTVSPDGQQIGFFQYSIPGVGSNTDGIFTNVPGGEYVISITNIVSGCSYIANATVDQPAKHFINATPDSIQAVPGETHEISVTSDFENPVYVWTPAGFNCVSPSCDSITATVDSNTVFYVMAYESGDSSCFVVDSVLITVQPEFLPDSLVMPTGFTPNGDTHNDTYGPVQSDNFSQGVIAAFRIYNRWGQVIHNSSEYWDGRFNGKEQPTGVYVYYIEVQYEDPNNQGKTKTVKLQGTVNLIR